MSLDVCSLRLLHKVSYKSFASIFHLNDGKLLSDDFPSSFQRLNFDSGIYATKPIRGVNRIKRVLVNQHTIST